MLWQLQAINTSPSHWGLRHWHALAVAMNCGCAERGFRAKGAAHVNASHRKKPWVFTLFEGPKHRGGRARIIDPTFQLQTAIIPKLHTTTARETSQGRGPAISADSLRQRAECHSIRRDTPRTSQVMPVIASDRQ